MISGESEDRAWQVAIDTVSGYQPHQIRVVDEKNQLDEKIANLVKFLDTPMFTTLSIAEQKRLHEQAVVMVKYSDILKDRISNFSK